MSTPGKLWFYGALVLGASTLCLWPGNPSPSTQAPASKLNLDHFRFLTQVEQPAFEPGPYRVFLGERFSCDGFTGRLDELVAMTDELQDRQWAEATVVEAWEEGELRSVRFWVNGVSDFSGASLCGWACSRGWQPCIVQASESHDWHGTDEPRTSESYL